MSEYDDGGPAFPVNTENLSMFNTCRQRTGETWHWRGLAEKPQ